MGRTRAELMHGMSAREFEQWKHYADLEPFGEERADLRASMVAMVIANANRNPKKQSKAFEIGDFMALLKPITTEERDPEAPAEEPSEEQRAVIAQKIAGVFGVPGATA